MTKFFRKETVIGLDGPYLFRLRIGKLAFHKFYRGDEDPDAHDHPADFYTFPLTTYVENVYDPMTKRWQKNIVTAFKFHFRPATYCHRVMGRWSGDRTSDGETRIATIEPGKAFWTIVWWKKRSRTWGFYLSDGVWVPWQEYINGSRKSWAA